MNKKLPINKKNNALITASAIGSIDSYVYWINQIPMLTAEEELEHANKFHKHGDLDAARKLIFPHLRFVVYIAKNYLGYGLSKSDLIQEGTIGLMKAVKRFDPTMGVRLVSFAVHWIKAEIHEFILRNWRIVRIATTKAQKKLFFNLRRAAKKFNWFSNDEILHVARELKVSPKEVRLMEMRMNNSDISFDYSNEEDGSEEEYYNIPINYLEAGSQNPADEVSIIETDKLKATNLKIALSRLDERSREIIQSRWLNENKKTLHQLAAKYGISAERVRQIEENAIQKVRKEIENHQ